MALASLHMLSFSLRNPYSFSLDRDGPFPALFRLLIVRSPSIHTLDLSEFADHTILITGATSGCGFECARALGRVGCNLILTSRNQQRGEDAKQQIQQEAKDAGVETNISVLELDMTSFQSVKSFPSRLDKAATHLDVAILNAGVYQTEFNLCSETGWEETVQVNVLATSALTLLLRPYLSRADSGRLLFVSSEAHAWADPHPYPTRQLLQELNTPDVYPCYQRYHISKLLLVLWASQIAHREEWSKISVASVSPGFSRTSLFRDFNGYTVAKVLENIVCRSSEQGSSQYMYALQNMAKSQGNGRFWSDGAWRSPSTAVSCKSGQEIQSTLYTDVVGILREAGVIDSTTE
ncbi:Short-chain dehydrogenase/reductase phmF [Cladobotryum mycophilum]|uniref:Short-chain dehydrogenase/reductase phmF n=1 Tax=Cladobotryum mycophilum TaxID=491253 RepID=A0ABR0SYG4_9HYPO